MAIIRQARYHRPYRRRNNRQKQLNFFDRQAQRENNLENKATVKNIMSMFDEDKT
jgi:hypothetical protein